MACGNIRHCAGLENIIEGATHVVGDQRENKIGREEEATKQEQIKDNPWDWGEKMRGGGWSIEEAGDGEDTTEEGEEII